VCANLIIQHGKVQHKQNVQTGYLVVEISMPQHPKVDHKKRLDKNAKNNGVQYLLFKFGISHVGVHNVNVMEDVVNVVIHETLLQKSLMSFLQVFRHPRMQRTLGTLLLVHALTDLVCHPFKGMFVHLVYNRKYGRIIQVGRIVVVSHVKSGFAIA
jgi:hypothetical protein